MIFGAGTEKEERPITPKFELGRDFLTTHLPTEFHHSVFNCSEIIVLRNIQTKKYKHTSGHCWKYPPRYAVLRRWRNILFADVRPINLTSVFSVNVHTGLI